MQSYVNKNRVFLLHLSFWCVYLSFFLYQISRWELIWTRVLIVATIVSAVLYVAVTVLSL